MRFQDRNLNLQTQGGSLRFKKIISSSSDLAHEDCVDTSHMTCTIYLNTAALSKSNSLKIKVAISNISDSIQTLLDSGSTHSFIEKTFIKKNKIKTYTAGMLKFSS